MFSKEDPVHLILDKHDPHLSIPTIVVAKENDISLLTLPPHTSHKLRPLDCNILIHTDYTWCGSKWKRLATLCTNRQCCCLPLLMAVRLNSAVYSVQIFKFLQLLRDCWEHLKWSCVCEVRYKTGQAEVWATLCHQILYKAWRIRYCDLWKLQRANGEHSLSRAQVFRRHKSFLEGWERVEEETRAGRPSTSKTDD